MFMQRPSGSFVKALAGLATVCILSYYSSGSGISPEGTASEPKIAEVPHRLDVGSLGKTLRALGIGPKKMETHYDFRFVTGHEVGALPSTMTANLSADESSLWLTAWLDELPDNPRSLSAARLLELLAENNRFDDGTYLVYVPEANRLALRRCLPNAELTAETLASAIAELQRAAHAEEHRWSASQQKERPAGQAAPQVPPRSHVRSTPIRHSPEKVIASARSATEAPVR